METELEQLCRTDQDEGIAQLAFDELVMNKGVTVDYAVQISRELFETLQRAPDVEELFALKAIDHTGKPHVFIAARQKPGAVTLFRFHIAKMRDRVRQEITEETEAWVELNDDDATEI